MRITIFDWRCFRHPQAGGSELYMHEQAKRWAAEGHEIIWITSRPGGVARRETKDGIHFVRAGGTYSVYLLAVLSYFRSLRPDVIIDVENGIPFFTPLYAMVPVVLLIHHVHTAVWEREASFVTAKVGAFLESCLMPWIYRRTPIVTVSTSSEEMVSRLFGRHAPIQIVHNGVSERLIPGGKADRPEIIYLGRLRRYKSIDILLHAVARLSDLSLVLHLAGQGEDEPRLRALAEGLGLRNVIFHGYTDESEKIRLLQRAWVAVNPSSMEGWGVTNIEANACGTPVIGSDVPGIRDSISPGKSGVLVPYGDVAAFAVEIRSLIENELLRVEMSRTACEWASRFSWDASASSFMGILEQDIVRRKVRL
jgi:glycosyltransferase involved in cell wall biosynthesis